MSEKDSPVPRRVFMADLVASGAVLMGSIAWALTASVADAGPPTKTPAPIESDRPTMPGVPPPPRQRTTPRPSTSPKPKGSPSARPPSEVERVQAPGDMVAPRPAAVEPDHAAKPGRVAAPPPSPRPKP